MAAGTCPIDRSTILRGIAVMSVIPTTAPWQLGPVSSHGRITAVALLALSLDAVWLRHISPSVVLAIPLVVGPFLVAVRVARGFNRSLPTAITTLGLIGLAIGAQVALGASVYGNTRNA